MNLLKQPIRIAITGPESTGKTTLALQLASFFHGQYISEYAREYIGSLYEHYTFGDVENIARKQVQQYQETKSDTESIFFFDTWLIITKIWFMWVFGRVPEWLETQIHQCPIDLYLLCRPDLPWEADFVRENGGENRLKLYDEYRTELINYGFNFAEISGEGDERFFNAIVAIRNSFDAI